MFFRLALRQRSAFKKNLSASELQRLFGASVRIGSVGPYDTFRSELPKPEGGACTYMLYGAGKQPLGRGFTLRVEKNGDCVFTTPLPAATHDLEDMFTLAGLLADHVGEKELLADDEPLSVAGITPYFASFTAKNGHDLKATAMEGAEFWVSTVRYPLLIPANLCNRIAGLPAGNGDVFFSAYLADKQNNSFAYLFPTFSREEQSGAVVGQYALAAGMPTILPKEPFVPLGRSPFEEEPVRLWLVGFVDEGGHVLGLAPYSTMMEHLDERDFVPFDDQNSILRGLSARRMKEILEA